MSCNAQRQVFGLRWRHPERPSGTRGRLRFLSKRLLQMIRSNIFTHFAESLRLSFNEMHGEKVGGVSCFVQQAHTNIVRTL